MGTTVEPLYSGHHNIMYLGNKVLIWPLYKGESQGYYYYYIMAMQLHGTKVSGCYKQGW
jgi:hypothetical protein